MAKLKENSAFIYYLPSLIFGIIALLSIHYQLFNYYLLLVISFGIIPFLELILNSSKSISSLKEYRSYDLLLYFIVPFQYIILFYYLHTAAHHDLSLAQSIGLITTMGICSGVYGINVAHELGHRLEKLDRFMAKSLLLTSLYMHFFIEHNRGHHKKVGTPEDPATARKGESLYAFWWRCIFQSFLSAYRLEAERLKRSGSTIFSMKNEFIRYMLLQLLFIVVIGVLFGTKALLFFLASSVFGFLLLETINYIEHYGLMRQKNSSGVYERVQPMHSWNSDHILGRYLLFELTRHSDHHENSLKKYESLESKEDALQLPTGYPGMMILSLLPPLWFRVMNKRLK